MESISEKIGFIGCGNMAEAIIRGLIASGSALAGQIWASDMRSERLEEVAAEVGINRAISVGVTLKEATVIILAVKPQNLDDLAEDLQGKTSPDHLFISILAGTRSEQLEEVLAHAACPSPRVVRVMPNTPALIREGASALAPGRYATQKDLKLAQTIFSSVGVAELVEPDQMDVITGLTGSGPAYVFRLIEALVWAAEARGLSRDKSERLVKQMVCGAAMMARTSEHSPAELRRRVTSPGGTTAAGLKVMEDAKFMELIDEVVEAASKRSKELGDA